MESTSRALLDCNYCTKPLGNEDSLVYCPDCGDPYHKECWGIIGKKCMVRDCHGNTLFPIKYQNAILIFFGIKRSKLKNKCPNEKCLKTISYLDNYCSQCRCEVNHFHSRNSFKGYNLFKSARNHYYLTASSAVITLVLVFVFMFSVFLNFSRGIGSDVSRGAPPIKITDIIPTITPTNRKRPTATPQPTATPRPTATRIAFRPYTAIQGCAQARVMIGDIVKPNERLGIRSSSDNHPSDNIIGRLLPGQKAIVISGPECSWKWMMWKIRRLSDGLEGWVAESNGKVFWLELAD